MHENSDELRNLATNKSLNYLIKKLYNENIVKASLIVNNNPSSGSGDFRKTLSFIKKQQQQD